MVWKTKRREREREREKVRQHHRTIWNLRSKHQQVHEKTIQTRDSTQTQAHIQFKHTQKIENIRYSEINTSRDRERKKLRTDTFLCSMCVCMCVSRFGLALFSSSKNEPRFQQHSAFFCTMCVRVFVTIFVRMDLCGVCLCMPLHVTAYNVQRWTHRYFCVPSVFPLFLARTIYPCVTFSAVRT